MGGKEVVENLDEEWWKKVKGVRGGRGRKEKEGSKERKQWFITWILWPIDYVTLDDSLMPYSQY